MTNGSNNLVTLKIHYGHVLFPKAGNNLALGNVSIEVGDVAYIGGLPADESLKAWGGHFKGCLQDIRLDHNHLTIGDHPDGVEVYQATSEENVLTGCQSDDMCKVKWEYFICVSLELQKIKHKIEDLLLRDFRVCQEK